MSVSSNGTVSTAQSMNGLITIYADDIITNTLTTNTFLTQNVESPVPASDSNVYILNTAGIFFGSIANFITIGSLCPTINIGDIGRTGITNMYGGTINIGHTSSTGTTNIYGGNNFNLSLNPTSTLTLGTGKTSGQTTIYGGTDTNIYTNNSFNLIGDATGRSNFKTILGTTEVYHRYYTWIDPTVMTCEVFVDVGGTYRVSTPYYQFYNGNNQYVTDLSGSIADTISLRYGCSSANPGVESARILIQNGTAIDYQGDITIESKTFNLLTQTDINIGTAITTNNNIGGLKILNNTISATGAIINIGTASATTNNIGTSSTTNNIGTLTTTNNNVGGLRITNNTISSPSLTTINMGDYIVPSYTYPITSSIGAIGNTYAGSTFTTGTVTTGTAYTVSSTASLPAGVYMVSANLPVNCTVTGLLTKISILIQSSGGTAFINPAFQSNGSFTVGTFGYPVTTVVSIVAATVLQLIFVLTFTSGTFTRVNINAVFTAVKIA